MATKQQRAALPARALEDLSGSGLDAAALLSLGAVQPCPVKDLTKYLPGVDTKEVEAALLFRYYHLNGAGVKPIEYDEYCRAKIYYAPPTGFAAQTTKDERPKYLQKSGTGVLLYIPPTLDWEDFRSNKDIPLVITEGEKKALAAASAGIHCVALGGVNSIANRRKDETVLPELAALARGRMVLIVFDVDKGHTTLKREVSEAAMKLSRILTNECVADTYLTVLPSDGTQKVALDDFIKQSRADRDISPLSKLFSHSLRSQFAGMLLKESQDYCYVGSLNAVARMSDRYMYPLHAYQALRSNAEVVVAKLVLDKNGLVAPVPTVKKLSTAWIEWSGRNSADRADYLPGVLSPVHEGVLNTWRGWAQPVPKQASIKDVAPFVDALKYLHGDDWGYMLDWYMYPLANPGEKLFTIPILQSEYEGIGKSVIPQSMVEYVYGSGAGNKPRNGWVMNAGSLDSNSRLEFAAESQFVLFDDMSDLKHVGPLLKGLATQSTLTLNEKYVRQRSVRNCINVTITTNRTNPLPMSDLDRRFYYPRIAEERNDTLWRKRFIPFMRDGGGGKLVAYASTEWRTTRGVVFDPMAPAPMTSKKVEMVVLSKTPLEEWSESLAHRAQRGAFNRDIATNRELTHLFMQECGIERAGDVNRIMFARALKLAGLHKYPVRVRVGDNSEVVYVLQNEAKWMHVKHTEIALVLKNKEKLTVKGARE